MAKPISLYLHIPFCRKKCPYCNFFVLPYSSESEAILVDSILLHLDQIKPSFFNKNILSVYFGGGTPSLLKESSLSRIIEKIHSLPTILSKQTEWTLEANPEDIDLAQSKMYQSLGINRVSLGVQSFQDRELVFLGRSQNKQRSVQAIEDLVSAGIENISIDLIFEIMNQKMDDFFYSVEQVQKLPITHLSLYDLLIEEGSFFYRKKVLLEKQRPDPEIATKMLQGAVERLESFGLNRYEISAFAKEGFQSQHNTGYWTGREFWGIGPSAFSFIEGERFQCIKNLKSYNTLLQNGQSPYDFKEKLDPILLEKELIGLRLRLIEGVAASSIGQVEIIKSLDRLTQQELVEKIDGFYRLTHRGRLFYDSVQLEILT